MMDSFIHDAAKAVEKPEVQNLMRELSKYGLAVCIPHMHRQDDGAFEPLPDNIVQSESRLKVKFVERSELNEHDIPVAWKWNNKLQVVQSCHVCRTDGPHH